MPAVYALWLWTTHLYCEYESRLSPRTARAQSNSANYIFVVASGFLCDPGDSGSCPAVAKSENGESYEISGAGTFDAQKKSIKAAGTFNRRSANGSVIETGAWTASDLVSFGSCGIAPTALMQKGSPFGHLQIVPKHLPLGLRPLPTGGLAVFRILLISLSGTTKTAMLRVNCALGEVPRERTVEGIRLTVEGNRTEFSEEVSGHVIFLSTRSEISEPPKPRPMLDTPETNQLPSN